MCKDSGHWVLHHLMTKQAELGLTMATNLLQHFNTEDQNFLSTFVVTVQTWVKSYKPEMIPQYSKLTKACKVLQGTMENKANGDMTFNKF